MFYHQTQCSIMAILNIVIRLNVSETLRLSTHCGLIGVVTGEYWMGCVDQIAGEGHAAACMWSPQGSLGSP